MNPVIINAQEVIDYFGYWPEFCDAKIESFSYEFPGNIELSVFYIDSALQKSAHIGLRFTGVNEIELNEFRSENVIDEIKIEINTELIVNIESAFGLCGKFSCTAAAVVYVHT